MTSANVQPDGARVVLLANGAFPQTERVVAIFNAAPILVCCDGAAESALAHGREPDFIVGDLDSLSDNMQIRFKDRLIRIEEQETNDLEKAFQFCLQRGWTDVVILGALGKRTDHALGNLSRLVDFAGRTENVAIVDDEGEFRVMTRSGVVRSHLGQQVSIFSFNPNQEITSKGLRYPLKRLKITRWHVATLNESLGDVFELTFNPENDPLLIFLSAEKKRAPK